MNYYEHHIGDFAEATSHLTFVEDAAYSRIIRKYYATERPMPADIKAVQRLVGARTKEERAAVETVLGEFFVLEADGWHQPRCDAEIARFQAGEPEREVKKANESNRLKRHRDERAELFKIVTEAGQHLPWNVGMGELREAAKRLTATAVETFTPPLPATAPATPATATQTPVPRHQTPDTSIEEGRARKRATRKCPPDFEVTDAMRDWARLEAPGVDLTRETAAFRDHEFKDAKTDWPAAWRNWLRRGVPAKANGHTGGYAAERNRAFAGEFADDAHLTIDEGKLHDIALPIAGR